jgi:hypothetical protein
MKGYSTPWVSKVSRFAADLSKVLSVIEQLAVRVALFVLAILGLYALIRHR